MTSHIIRQAKSDSMSNRRRLRWTERDGEREGGERER